jgi:hypothetical protein
MPLAPGLLRDNEPGLNVIIASFASGTGQASSRMRFTLFLFCYIALVRPLPQNPKKTIEADTWTHSSYPAQAIRYVFLFVYMIYYPSNVPKST